MSNMNYCRFENTLSDLGECFEALEEEGLVCEEDSSIEARARKELVALCVEIGRKYGANNG